MSKLDAQRAMREAAYTARQSGTAPAARGRARLGATTPPVAPAAPSTPASAPAPSAETGEACGHRSMNGRTCTRPAGHEEKNHRYG